MQVSSSHPVWEPLDLPGEVIIVFAMSAEHRNFGLKNTVGGRSQVSNILGFM